MIDLDQVRFDGRGLVTVVAQDALVGDVLMVAWADRTALEATLRTGRMHYHSRRRGETWEKGATSGATQTVRSLALDCDGDTVLALVEPAKGACHTGAATCFVEDGPARAELSGLAAMIESRRTQPPETSYTSRLLKDPGLASKKIGEECAELVRALAAEGPDRVAEEAADVLYHVLVACQARGVALRDVAQALARRRTPAANL